MACSWLTIGALSSVPKVTLNNGVEMPRLAISLPKTAGDATANIKVAFANGVAHFVTANDYLNQRAVGVGLKALGTPRSSYFVTTMTSPCQCNQTIPHCSRNISDLAECEAVTAREVLSDLRQLNLTYVDLLLLHGPNLAADHVGACDRVACAANRAQWRAYTELNRLGKARAIGIGNVCPSCFDCLLESPANGVLVPAVTQIQYVLPPSAHCHACKPPALMVFGSRRAEQVSRRIRR